MRALTNATRMMMTMHTLSSSCRWPALFISTLALSACAAHTTSPALSADQDMTHILSALDTTGAVRFPMVRDGSVLPAEMNRPVSWHWQGPLDQAVRLLAARAGYRTEIPAHTTTPVIRIDRDDTTLGRLFDEMAAASADVAGIEIDVPDHLVKVVWHA